MALISMAVFDTEENKRTSQTEETLRSLLKTVDLVRHRLVISDNGSCDATHEVYDWAIEAIPTMRIILNHENLGTARAINRAWQLRKPGERCLKMDNDVRFHESGWLDKLEECVNIDPRIGIIGLKRKDLAETPHAPAGDWNHSDLIMLPHTPGHRWLIVEKAAHVMGTCQLYNSALLDKMGYLVQFGKYGLDDCLAAIRCAAAGFYSCFYPHYEIDHLDPGDTPYQGWKEAEAKKRFPAFGKLRHAYLHEGKSVYHGPDEDLDGLWA